MRLLITGEEAEGREFPLERDEVLIGRAPESDVLLESRDVSRRHARLSRDVQGWGVEDLGSASGTRVDGLPFRGRRPFSHGESMEIGSYVLTLALDDTELPTLPPHPAAVTARSAPNSPVPSPARRWPVLVALVVIAVAAGWSWNAGRARAARCRAAEQAFARHDWKDAGDRVRALLTERAACTAMDLDALASAADRNLAAGKALESARRLLDLREWDGALAAVATAPAESVYAEELRQVEAQARRGQADMLAAALEAAFAAGDAVEAQRLIEQLSRTGLDDRLLMVWRDRLSTLREAAAPPTPVRAPPVEGPLPRQAAEPAATAARRPLSERDAEARRLYEAAGNDIRASDMLGAVDKLQLALEADPSRSLRCQVLRSLGVAYARSGKKLETARTYRAYLDCDPKAPDRPQLERIVRDARPEKP